MKERAYKLMKEWCDTMLTFQVRNSSPYIDGTMLCPACHVLHGRLADLTFPFTLIWSRTGDESYLENADLLIEWSEYNLKTPEGVWYNDAGNRWKWTTSFSCMSLGETLHHFGETLPIKYKEKWTNVYKRLIEALYKMSLWFADVKDKPVNGKPITNYFCSMAAAMALAWKNLGEQKYYDMAFTWLGYVLERFDNDGLLFGEGHANVYDDGSHLIDMGYNLEESFPLLMRFASITGKYKEFILEKFRLHTSFILPDGGIDNSFGSRHNKWTYWGSRTSDGIIEGLAFAMDDPWFVDVARRTLDLYEKCTHDGLLAMPMAHEVGEPTCLHHTFPHAKALASFICDAPDDITIGEPIPAEKYGVRKFQNDKLIQVSHGVFRATISAQQAMYINKAENCGGSLNLLYVDGYGIACAATSAYYLPSEPLNQQYLRSAGNTPCMTAQFVVDGNLGCQDRNVDIVSDGTTVTTTAEKWQAKYAFDENKLTIDLSCENGVYNFPIVCSKNNSVVVSEDGHCVTIANVLRIRSNVLLTVDPNERVFNQVGGLLYLPIYVNVNGKATVTLEKI